MPFHYEPDENEVKILEKKHYLGKDTVYLNNASGLITIVNTPHTGTAQMIWFTDIDDLREIVKAAEENGAE